MRCLSSMESYCVALDALKEGVRGYVGNSLVDSFVIYTDASKLRCGSVHMQHGLVLFGSSRLIHALLMRCNGSGVQLNTRDLESCARSCISKFSFWGRWSLKCAQIAARSCLFCDRLRIPQDSSRAFWSLCGTRWSSHVALVFSLLLFAGKRSVDLQQ